MILIHPLLEILATVIIAWMTLVDYSNTITTEYVPGAIHHAQLHLAVLGRLPMIVALARNTQMHLEHAKAVQLVCTLSLLVAVVIVAPLVTTVRDLILAMITYAMDLVTQDGI